MQSWMQSWNYSCQFKKHAAISIRWLSSTKIDFKVSTTNYFSFILFPHNFFFLVLAQEEYAFGYFLRNHGELDKTRAGKMMSAVGKAMIYSSQQRGNLRAPLTRLHQVECIELFFLQVV